MAETPAPRDPNSFREIFFNKVFSLRNLFFLFNFLVLGLFVLSIGQDFFREWKPYQAQYKKLEKERLKKEIEQTADEVRKAELKDQLKTLRWSRPEVKQILANDLNRVDRCITCHAGYDSFSNPSLTNAYQEHPYAAPKNDIHAKHALENYGCTVCHEGQGLATTFVDAAHMPKSAEQKAEWKKKHDWQVVHYWEQPMKAGPLIYASCSKCHEAHPNVPGLETVKMGQRLFNENGCIGCHQVRGEGGPLAPDLAEETAVKPLTRIDFGYAVHAGLIDRDERTLENWIRLHFTTAPSVITPGDPEGKMSADPKNPQPVAPSPMPYFGFDPAEVDAITAYVMSLKSEKTIPYTYRVFAAKAPEPRFDSAIKHGRYVFEKYGCGGCHGKDANSGISVYNRQGERVPDLVKVVGTYTQEELIEKIQKGVNPEQKADPNGPVPPLFMPAFKERIQGQEMQNLVKYLFSIAEKQEEW